MTRKLIFSFTKKDFRVDHYIGSGPGGQSRNKNKTAVRITHIESGLSACNEDSKSQSANKRNAFRKLVPLLLDHYLPKDTDERAVHDATNTRTYNECTDRVKDHKTGDTFSYRQTVGKGDLSKIIEARMKWVK